MKLESVEHSDLIFTEFLTGYDGRVCPAGGELGFSDGKVKCSVHSVDEDEDPSVPFL
ncbi:hypothetical protein [Niallia oryzisoli]|uniref:hypothetical protein n=1 Tax=Niallia oryzisoli TaxID=1737571 RepID=UPI003735C960